jgi:hypothetical protein
VILTVFGIHKRQFWNTSKRRHDSKQCHL